MQVDLKNRKLLKEWNKIKDFNIFQDINEFALLFYEKPYGICMRKYTSYPWCKENFFFGSYDELKEWYQTTDEIPFYVKEVVGQKLGRLTVLDFLYKHNSKGIRTLHAKCKCDCGNTVEADYRNLKHGDIVSCGCRVRNKEPQIIKPLTEEIIEFWDFDKNAGIDPYKISQMSTEKFWWKDNEGNSYQLAPYVFAKEDKTHSSFPEQALFYYIKKEYSSAINRANFITADGEVLEIDIYIPTYNIGIEYDGLFWHKNKAETDTYKSNVLFENGVYLIRIRENGLPDLNVKDFIINQCPYNSTNEREFVETINKVLNEINYRTNNIGYAKLAYEDFIQNKNSVFALFYNKPIENSIKDTCIGKFWDKEKNGILKPEYINSDCNIPIFFTCSFNQSFKIRPKTLFEKISVRNKIFKCNTFYNSYDCNQVECCPFSKLSFCNMGSRCLYRKGYELPILKCENKSIRQKAIRTKNKIYRYYDCGIGWVEKALKSVLELSFINKSAFPFSTETVGAFWTNHSKIKSYNYCYFQYNYRDIIIQQGEIKNFNFLITEELFNNIQNSTLIIYQLLFKEEYMRGWRFYNFLILHFDENGKIIGQESKIVSNTEFEGELDFRSNYIYNSKKVIEKILSL